MSSNKKWTAKTYMQMKEDIILANAKKKQSREEAKKKFSEKWGVNTSGTNKIFKILDPTNQFSKICRGK